MNNNSDGSSNSSIESGLSDSLPINSLIASQQEMLPHPEVLIDNNSLCLNNQIPIANPRINKTSITLPFIVFFALNTLCFIHSYLISFDQAHYSFTLWCIIQKGQYYRMLTHHFYHLGFLHYLFTMSAYYFLSKRLENQIGSIYTFILTMQSIVFISLIYLFILLFLKIVHISTLDCNFWLQCGFSFVCICLYQFYYLLTKNQEEIIDLLLFTMRPKHSAMVFILLFQIIVPKLSIIGHISGFLVANLTYKLLLYLSFPDKEWIKEFEECCCLRNCYSVKCIVFYVPIDQFNEETVEEISSFLKFKTGLDAIKETIGEMMNRKTNSNGNGSGSGNSRNRNEDNTSNASVNRNNQHIEMVNEERLDNDS